MSNRIPQTNRVDRFAYRWASMVIQHRWKTIAITLAVALVFAAGLARIEVANNYRVFYSDENPDLMAFEQFEETYTKNDNFLFVFKPKAGTIEQPFVMQAVEEFTEKAWSIPYTIRVDSLTNFQHTYGLDDDLIVEDLIENAAGQTQDELAERIDIAMAEPLLYGQLVATDRGATGVNVTLQMPYESLSEIPDSASAARALVAEFEAAYPELEVAIAGFTSLNVAFAEAPVNDAKTLFGPMFIVLLLITWLIVRSVAATGATVFVISFATLTAMGFAGWVGIQFSPFSASAPVVILTLAIADSIHILVTMTQRMRSGDDKITALKESVRVNFLAVTITSVTTIIGFLALNFSDAPPFNALGNIAAVGIAAAWFFSLTFFPAFLAVLPVKVKPIEAEQSQSLLQRYINRIAEFVIARTRAVLLVVGAVFIGLAAAVPTIDLNDEWIKYFDYRLEFRGDVEFAMEHLTGAYILEYSIQADGQGAINDPAYLKELEDFTQWLRAQAEVRHVYSYTDIIKRLNKNMHGDDPSWYRIPEDRELAAQYLLLFEMSLPYGLDMNDRIDVGKSSSRVTVTLDELSSREAREFFSKADAWWATNHPTRVQYATGATYLFSYISERNINDMIGGNIVAVILIALILVLALGSVKLGALSLIPNIVPLIMTFGIWALLVGVVGMAAATVSATSLGIIVDNTVHFLMKYRRARKEQGLSAQDAIRYSFDTVGSAIAANALILALGFSVLSLSYFKITSEMGILTALAIVVALVVDFFLLPALLLVRAQPETQSSAMKGVIHVATDTEVPRDYEQVA